VIKKDDIIRDVLNDSSRFQALLGTGVSADFEVCVRYLASKGVNVSRLEDLKSDLEKWKRAVPEIPRLIEEVQTGYVKEALVACLAVPFAKRTAEDVVRLFHSIDDEQFRWAAGNALEVIASNKIAPQIIEIALNRSFGPSRQMVVLALGKLRTREAATAAMSLLDDESVVLHALGALAKLRTQEALPRVEVLLQHKRAAVRKEARKTLKRILKAKPAKPGQET
jgi:HEAT repeat protein